MERQTETLEFEFNGRGSGESEARSVLVGVVSSGNLEVMVEPADLQGKCKVAINTSARGFGEVWNAVLEDFFDRHSLSDVRISINDMGATPAVVSLRLDQAIEEFQQPPA
jgi:malonate decarboxylase delta subunit